MDIFIISLCALMWSFYKLYYMETVYRYLFQKFLISRQVITTLVLINNAQKEAMEEMRKNQKKRNLFIVSSVPATFSCSICMGMGGDFHETTCGHFFHSKCFSQFLMVGGESCPICRKQIKFETIF